jgi:single stranded DNA-binding protein
LTEHTFDHRVKPTYAEREELDVSDNQVTLVGNLTDDPELRFTPKGTAVATFRLAVNQRLWDGDGWKDGEPSFFRVNVWRDQAQHVSQSLAKGARCVVVGRLKSRSWETPEGERRSAVEVDAEDVAASLRFAPLVRADPGERREEPEPVAAGMVLDEVPF